MLANSGQQGFGQKKPGADGNDFGYVVRTGEQAVNEFEVDAPANLQSSKAAQTERRAFQGADNGSADGDDAPCRWLWFAGRLPLLPQESRTVSASGSA